MISFNQTGNKKSTGWFGKRKRDYILWPTKKSSEHVNCKVEQVIKRERLKEKGRE